MVKKIWLIMITILMSLVSVNAGFYVDANDIMQIECLNGEGISINGVSYPSVVSVNATIQTGCLYMAMGQFAHGQLTEFYINGYEPNTIIDETTSNLYFTESGSGIQGIAPINFGENLIDIHPQFFSLGNNIIINGHPNLNITAYLDRSGYSTIADFSQIEFNNFNQVTIFDDALTPYFSVEPYYYNYNYNDEVLIIESNVFMDTPYLITEITNLYKDGVLVDSRNSTGLSPDGSQTIQHSFTLSQFGKGVYHAQVILVNENYPFENSNPELYGTNNNKFYFNTTDLAYGELYYVPNLENIQIELPINNDTTFKFNGLGQSFTGNNETLTNASFYFSNYGSIPLYDINVKLFEAVYDEGFAGFDCQFIPDTSTAVSLSNGFIDKNLISDTAPILINFNMSPYFLEAGKKYCLFFSTNNNQEGTNDIVMYMRTTDPYNIGDLLKTNYGQIANYGGGVDMAGFIYSTTETIAILGCTNPIATNYNPLATQDDGSCTLPEIPVTQGLWESKFTDAGQGIDGFLQGVGGDGLQNFLFMLVIFIIIASLIGGIIYLFVYWGNKK